MSCSPFDLRDYFLKELPEAEGRQVEVHVRACQGCREELERLRLTETALAALGEEEITQRIAFVSDKVFEAAPWRRWLTGFWESAARLGFASAVVLAGAIVFHAAHQAARPAEMPRPVQMAAQTVVRTVSDDEIQVRVDSAVAKALAQRAVADRQLVAELEATRRRLVIAAGEYEFSRRRVDMARAESFTMPPQRSGEPQ